MIKKPDLENYIARYNMETFERTSGKERTT